MNKTLQPDDAGKILEELLEAQNQSFMLGLGLNLRLHEVKAIHAKYQDPCERLLHVIISFLRQAEARPKWRVIVEALRNPIVNLPALARRVEAANFPDPTVTCDVVTETTSMSPSPPSDWCNHICIISDTESAANPVGDIEVKSKILSPLIPATGNLWFNSSNTHYT